MTKASLYFRDECTHEEHRPLIVDHGVHRPLPLYSSGTSTAMVLLYRRHVMGQAVTVCGSIGRERLLTRFFLSGDGSRLLPRWMTCGGTPGTLKQDVHGMIHLLVNSAHCDHSTKGILGNIAL